MYYNPTYWAEVFRRQRDEAMRLARILHFDDVKANMVKLARDANHQMIWNLRNAR